MNLVSTLRDLVEASPPLTKFSELEVRLRGPRGAPLTTDMAWAVFRAATRLDGCIEKHYFVDAVLPPNIRVRQFGDEPTAFHSKTEVARRLVSLNRNFQAKLVYSHESPVQPPPNTFSVRRVRVGQRRSATRGNWRIDFTVCHEGPSVEAALASDKRNEIEFEFIGTSMGHTEMQQLSSWFRAIMHDLS